MVPAADWWLFSIQRRLAAELCQLGGGRTKQGQTLCVHGHGRKVEDCFLQSDHEQCLLADDRFVRN